MTNEQRAARLDEIATHYIQIGIKDAALLRECAAMMREREACPDGYYLYSKKDEKAGYNDGCILWWKPNGAGYTTNLHEAGVFTQEYKDKAQRKELVFVPCHLAWGSSFVARTAWRRSLKAAAVAWVDEQEGKP